MSEAPNPEEREPSANAEYKYNFAQASRILEAMDILRNQAVNTRIPEIITMVDASFGLLITTYYCILRYEMQRLSGTDIVQ
jgi:hypothetical protein